MKYKKTRQKLTTSRHQDQSITPFFHSHSQDAWWHTATDPLPRSMFRGARQRCDGPSPPPARLPPPLPGPRPPAPGPSQRHGRLMEVAGHRDPIQPNPPASGRATSPWPHAIGYTLKTWLRGHLPPCITPIHRCRSWSWGRRQSLLPPPSSNGVRLFHVQCVLLGPGGSRLPWSPSFYRQLPLTCTVDLGLRDPQCGHGLAHGHGINGREMGFYIDDHIDIQKYGHGHGNARNPQSRFAWLFDLTRQWASCFSKEGWSLT